MTGQDAEAPVWIARCLDCGWLKRFESEGGIDAKERAERSKAGHIGGGSRHYRTGGPCEDVVAVEEELHGQIVEYLESVADRYELEEFYAGEREDYIQRRFGEILEQRRDGCWNGHQSTRTVMDDE